MMVMALPLPASVTRIFFGGLPTLLTTAYPFTAFLVMLLNDIERVLRDSFSGLLSIQANDQWRIGYAHDFGVSKLTTRSGGSHEILLSYDPVFNNERIRSPRYF